MSDDEDGRKTIRHLKHYAEFHASQMDGDTTIQSSERR